MRTWLVGNVGDLWLGSACLLASFAVTGICAAQVTSADPSLGRYGRLVSASTLNKVGKPFRLRVSFQLFDLLGTPFERGNAEEDWDGTSKTRITIDAPSLHLNLPEEEERADKDAMRESFLVREVFTSLVHPMKLSFDPSKVDFKVSDQSLGSYQGHCFAVVPAGGVISDTTQSYCSDINGSLGTIRGGGDLIILRDHFETFGDKQIPRSIEVLYAERLAISGEVTELVEQEPESLRGSIELGNADKYGLFGEMTVAASQMKFFNHKAPSYPFEAKMKHIQGMVVICAVIGKDGKIAALDIVASPDNLLSRSAIETVRKWTYEPYQLHGSPSSVSTTIYVKFALGKF